MGPRIFLIEPQWRCVREYEIKTELPAFDAFVCGVLNCRTYAKSPPLAADYHGGFDAIHYSNDKLVKRRGNPRFWFEIDICSDPIPGRGLVLGADAGGSIHDVQIRSYDLWQRLCFTQRTFRGYKNNRLVAPIIKGATWEVLQELRTPEAHADMRNKQLCHDPRRGARRGRPRH